MFLSSSHSVQPSAVINACYLQGSHLVSEEQAFYTGPYQTPQYHIILFQVCIADSQYVICE
jgi:hypothetical protein